MVLKLVLVLIIQHMLLNHSLLVLVMLSQLDILDTLMKLEYPIMQDILVHLHLHLVFSKEILIQTYYFISMVLMEHNGHKIGLELNHLLRENTLIMMLFQLQYVGLVSIHS